MAGLILKAPYYSPNNNKSRGGMVKYIATREGVEIVNRGGMAGYIGERPGSSGLFSDEGKPVVLSRVQDEVDKHPGNVWTLIFSLSREDAERLGYNSVEQWMNLLRSHRNDIAKSMHISPENFRWYAAYHNKEEHPHVHMLAWSAKPQEPYLNKNGIHEIKKVIAHDIFRQDLISIYRKQTIVRDELKEECRKRMKEIVDDIQNSELHNPVLVDKIKELSEKLESVKGKKVYGYLDKSLKSSVDDIVKLIATDDRISELYELWYQYKCETYRAYTDVMPPKIPLERNKEFKSIRNSVVSSAVSLGRVHKHTGEDKHRRDWQISSDILRILRFSSRAIEESVHEDYKSGDGIDSRMHREIEAKKHGYDIHY